MKILYIHQYFRLPEEGGCIRSYHLAKGLVDVGHEVVVITAHNSAQSTTKKIAGFTVYYLGIPYDNSLSFRQRIWAFLSFIKGSIQKARAEKSVHLAYVMTTPLSTAITALYLRWFRKTPYYFEVGDLWPEVPVKMGLLRNPIFKKAAYWLESLAYRNAQKIIALSPGIADYIQERHPDQMITVIPNISDLDYFGPSSLPSKPLKVLYCGTIGQANHLEYLLDIAKASLKHDLAIEFTIIGSGGRKDRIKQLAGALSNVVVKDFVTRQELRQVVDEHHAFYVSFQNIDVLHTGSPNKYFDGLAAGKLMILNLGGWLERLTEENQCGFSYDPHVPEMFIKKITPFLTNPAQLAEAQANALSLAKDFSVPHLQEKFANLFE